MKKATKLFITSKKENVVLWIVMFSEISSNKSQKKLNNSQNDT